MASFLYLLVLLLSTVTLLSLAKAISLPSDPTPSSSIAAIQALIQRPNKNPAKSHFLPPISSTSNKAFTDEHDLLDIVLVASVDGKFHAFNRSSGHVLWSMAASPDSSAPPDSLSPLVRTNQIEYDPDLMDETTGQEVYIIEPQSGDIYVMSTPSGPLQRFPFSMTELVEMSPFRFNADGGHRVFVGKKETSLLVLELETGRIKAVLDSKCPWPDFEEFQHNGTGEDIDLDELEGSKPSAPPPTEVYIGRTDYHLSIYTRPNGPHSSPINIPTQNLTFSMYGPNKQDTRLQAAYRRTRDDTYIQSLPNGDIMSFKIKSSSPQTAKSDSQMLWYSSFNNPIVAVFDVLRNPDPRSPNAQPFVLLQPRPRLQDVLPNFNEETASTLPNAGSAYVGMIEETGSLFAMSPDTFPLVIFGSSTDRPRKTRNRLVEGGPSSSNSVDEITRARKEREEWEEQCENGGAGKSGRCFVGIHKLVDADERRMLRLLPGVPGVESSEEEAYQVQPVQHPYQQTYPPTHHYPTGAQQADGAVATINDSHGSGQTIVHSIPPYPHHTHPPRPEVSAIEEKVIVQRSGFLEGALVTLLVGGLSLWFGMKKISQSIQDTARSAVKQAQEIHKQSTSEGDNKPVIGQEDLTRASNPSTSASTSSISNTQSNTHTAHEPQVSTPSMTDQPTSSSPSPPGIVLEPASPIPPPDGVNGTTPAAPLTANGNDAKSVKFDDGEESGGEGDGEPDTAATPGKKKTRRGRRGTKKKKQASGEQEAPAIPPAPSTPVLPAVEPPPAQQSPSLVIANAPKAVATPSLIVSDTILGFGSHGTVVFQGSLQGRSVAVKRLLQDFVTLASREVSILQESDDHPNVIRYYYQEAHSNFLYIALELCPASLADIIESPNEDKWRDIAIAFEPKKALKQITSGLRHLHGLKLVHRDIKPQNILISPIKNNSGGRMGYRMLISDFGLCKKLDVDQTSFAPTAYGAMAAGTVGWRAPEILRGEVKLDEINDDGASFSSRGSTATVTGSTGGLSDDGSSRKGGKPRLTKSVDIFALGCLFYYTLTNGGHPFGDRYEREVNIMKNAKNLEGLERFGEEGAEAVDLINMMLDPEALKRPDTMTCLLHPFFWDSSRRLNFLQDASDRFEIMCRDPKDPYLITLEKDAQSIVGNDWHSRLDKTFIENLGKFRKYDGKSVQDLLRALRNKKHHYQDLPENAKRNMGPMPEGFLAYFTKRFPKLFLHVHEVIRTTGLRTESMFRSYFELPE
ncbi:hypothetical protein AX16_003963 [Volvariella volvacea WC 439]|nr:hypothetical protein AX16_003963 [Volvariella volvacea WC 439]